jgi:hypothetical protein
MNAWDWTKQAGIALTLAVTAVAAAMPFSMVSVPKDVTALLPEGAYVLGYTESIEGLQQDLLKTVTAVEPQMAMMVAMAGPVSSLNMLVKKEGKGPGSSGMVTDAGVAFFAGPQDPATGSPISGVIFKVADTSSLAASQPGMHIVSLPGSNWAALSNAPYTPANASSSLSSGMLGASVSANIDQAKLLQEYGPMIDGMLAMMQQVPPGLSEEDAVTMRRLQEANAAKVRMFMHMISKWNIGINFDGPVLDALVRMTPTDLNMLTKPGAGLQALARMVPGDMPMTAVLDLSSLKLMMEMSRGDLNSLPPEAKAKMEALWPKWVKPLSTVKTGVAMGMSFSDKGLEVVSVADTTDPSALLQDTREAWQALLAADIGVSGTEIKVLRGTGIGYLVKIDANKMMDTMGMSGMSGMMPPAREGQPDPMAMLQTMVDTFWGADGLPVRYLIEGDHMVTVIGNSRLVETRKLAADGGADNDLSKLFGDTLAPSTYAIDLDIRQLAGDGLRMAQPMLGPMAAMLPPSIPAGDPVRLSIVGSSNGKTWDQIRIRTNMKNWYAMIQQMQAPPVASRATEGSIAVGD